MFRRCAVDLCDVMKSLSPLGNFSRLLCIIQTGFSNHMGQKGRDLSLTYVQEVVVVLFGDAAFLTEHWEFTDCLQKSIVTVQVDSTWEDKVPIVFRQETVHELYVRQRKVVSLCITIVWLRRVQPLYHNWCSA